MPTIVVATSLFSLLFLFMFEYTDGSVIAALAILETPTSIEDENPQETGLFVVGKIEDPPTGRSGRTTRDESENAREFLWSLRHNSIRELFPTLCGGFLGLAGLFVLSLAGVIDSDPNNIVTGFLICGSIMIMGNIFTISTTSNAVTNQRSLARRHLHNERGFWFIFTGLEEFMIYMLLTVVIMALSKPISAEDGATFPVLGLSRLLLGLSLTNLHAAWVHTVVSKPRKQTIWQRIPGWREWLEILPVAFLDIVLPNCVHYLATTLLAFFRGVVFAALSNQAYERIPYPLTTCANIVFHAIPIVSEYSASILTGAMYVRVAASMLPENEQTVVPFDRSFGGRAKNGTRCLSILDAFRTMKVQNWYRYLKNGWEVLIREYVWVCFSIIVIAMELYLWAPCTAVDLLACLRQHIV